MRRFSSALEGKLIKSWTPSPRIPQNQKSELAKSKK